MNWIKVMIICIFTFIPLFFIELILLITEHYFFAKVLVSGMLIGYALIALVSCKKEIEKNPGGEER